MDEREDSRQKASQEPGDGLTTALSEDIALRKRLEILDSFGAVYFDPAYDYKAGRNR
jgi:hypothetical protein